MAYPFLAKIVAALPRKSTLFALIDQPPLPREVRRRIKQAVDADNILRATAVFHAAIRAGLTAEPASQLIIKIAQKTDHLRTQSLKLCPLFLR